MELIETDQKEREIGGTSIVLIANRAILDFAVTVARAFNIDATRAFNIDAIGVSS